MNKREISFFEYYEDEHLYFKLYDPVSNKVIFLRTLDSDNITYNFIKSNFIYFASKLLYNEFEELKDNITEVLVLVNTNDKSVKFTVK
jgi:hypothetical protein